MRWALRILAGQGWLARSPLRKGGPRMRQEPSWKCSSQKSLQRTIVSFFLLEHFWLCFCLSPCGILIRTGTVTPATGSPAAPTPPQQGKGMQREHSFPGAPLGQEPENLALWPFRICPWPCPPTTGPCPPPPACHSVIPYCHSFLPLPQVALTTLPRPPTSDLRGLTVSVKAM